ncbi:MAG: hypothetical protein ACLVBP_12225 [Ruminococcus sp.]
MQFQTGNPTYVAGKTGCELVKEVIRNRSLLIPELEDEMYLDKSPSTGVVGHWPIINGTQGEAS